MRRLTILGLAEAVGADSLGGLTEEEVEWLERITQIDRSLMPSNMRANMPTWLFDKLIAQFGEAETMKLADALNAPAPLDLRVNSLKATRDDVMLALAEAPILSTPTPYAPLGLRVIKKPSLQNLPLFQSGAIEVQDEGSQILSQIVGAKRGEMVVDFCAGAGGKTSHWAHCAQHGPLYDSTCRKASAKLKPRMARSGLSNVHPVQIAHERMPNQASGRRSTACVVRPCTAWAPCAAIRT